MKFYKLNTNNFIMQEAIVELNNPKNKLDLTTFISLAQKYNMINILDLKILKKAIKDIQLSGIQHKIIINLSIESLLSLKFIDQVIILLKSHKKISQNLVFSINTHLVKEYFSTILHFTNIVHTYNSKVMLKRFDKNLIDEKELQILNIDYIKLNQHYKTELTNSQSLFIKKISKYNLSILLENQANKKNYQRLLDTGIIGFVV
jgi:EAL domain-containing protein (putative c-di-GMP-specific phosphodiesterase class I)